MHGVESAARRLGVGNAYVYAAVRAVVAGRRPEGPPDGPTWRERAGQHGVLSVITEHLQPSTDLELRAVRLRRTANHLRTMADLRFVREVYGDAGLEWLAFKGPVLSEVVYERPGTRDCRDLDILVRPEDADTAVRLLLDRGATPLHPDWRAVRALGDGECEFLLPHGTQVDLHWDVINDGRVRPDFAVGTEQLLAGARTVVVGDLPVPTLGRVDTALHVALHGCRSGGDRLRWLLDLQQGLVHCRADAAELLERARSLRVELALRCMLNRLTTVLGERGVPDLPGPTAAHRVWLAADTAVLSRYPPGSGFEGRFSGAIVPCATRGGAGRSWLALARATPRTLWTRRRPAARQRPSAAL